MNAQTKVEAADNVYRRLNRARLKFHATELKKTGHNKFAGYNYFELGDFLVPALKIFEEVGLIGIVSFESGEAIMRIYNVDAPEAEFIMIRSPMGSAALKGCHEVQNVGAVETYQRRYLWVTALEIVEHDALDATNGKEAPAKDAHHTSDEPPAKPRGSAHSALKQKVRGFVHNLNGCGDGDELSAYLATPEAIAVINEVQANLPDWWTGWPEQPDGFTPLCDLITKRQQECAAVTASYATV